jgi:hypothetical protein
MDIGKRSPVSRLWWFLFLNERRPRFPCSVGFWLQFLSILLLAIYIDHRKSVICCLFGLWWFEQAIVGACTSHIDEAWLKMVVRPFHFLSALTTTCVAIMTQNGNDQQQTLSVCLLYAQG